MKLFIALVALSTILVSGISRPEEVHAGAADTIVTLAVIGGAVYAGYHFSQHYDVKKKSALEIEDGKITLGRPDVGFEVTGSSMTASTEAIYSVGLVTLNF